MFTIEWVAGPVRRGTYNDLRDLMSSPMLQPAGDLGASIYLDRSEPPATYLVASTIDHLHPVRLGEITEGRPPELPDWVPPAQPASPASEPVPALRPVPSQTSRLVGEVLEAGMPSGWYDRQTMQALEEFMTEHSLSKLDIGWDVTGAKIVGDIRHSKPMSNEYRETAARLLAEFMIGFNVDKIDVSWSRAAVLQAQYGIPNPRSSNGEIS